jgi:ABC-2 type transport system ATP-binding protein
MIAALETTELGKCYGRKWALRDCTLSIPAGKVVGLVGPNGAGKSTLLHLAVGLLEPSKGTIGVLGRRPASGPQGLARVGFLPQDSPVYARLTVAQHLRMGAWLNPSWDGGFASGRVRELGLVPRQRAGTLSGGQRAQLALTVALAKQPELLALDEPVAALDPLARREFLQTLMEVVAARSVSVVLSSHLVADLERICDHLVVLVSGGVALDGDVETLLRSHHRLVGPRKNSTTMPRNLTVIDERHVDKQSTLIVRTDEPILDPTWTISSLSLDDLVIAYMQRPRGGAAPTRTGLAVAR